MVCSHAASLPYHVITPALPHHVARFRIAANKSQAAAKALNAGVDQDLQCGMVAYSREHIEAALKDLHTAFEGLPFAKEMMFCTDKALKDKYDDKQLSSMSQSMLGFGFSTA